MIQFLKEDGIGGRETKDIKEEESTKKTKATKLMHPNYSTAYHHFLPCFSLEKKSCKSCLSGKMWEKCTECWLLSTEGDVGKEGEEKEEREKGN